MQEKKRIGELLLEAGFISHEQLQQALRMQVGGERRLGRIFLQMGAITNDQLVEILSKQLNLPVMNVERSFDPHTAKKMLPRYLCRRYGVLPLRLEDNRILSVAMVDPSDTEAIRDIESYTGKAVYPCLARHQDILAGIKKHVPLSLKDLRNPTAMAALGKSISIVTLVLIVMLSVFGYQYYVQARYGDITQTEQATLYKNHDLIVGYDQSGEVTLLGRGAYTTGYYSITFKSSMDFIEFINTKKADFSERQFEWIQWTLSAKK